MGILAVVHQMLPGHDDSESVQHLNGQRMGQYAIAAPQPGLQCRKVRRRSSRALRAPDAVPELHTVHQGGGGTQRLTGPLEAGHAALVKDGPDGGVHPAGYVAEQYDRLRAQAPGTHGGPSHVAELVDLLGGHPRGHVLGDQDHVQPIVERQGFNAFRVGLLQIATAPGVKGIAHRAVGGEDRPQTLPACFGQ